MRRQKLCEGVQVKDVRWNAELGGQNMKLRLVEHFADEFNKQVGGGIDVRKFPKAMAKLKKQVRYRPNTPLVLKGITLSIYGGEKIGVAGRTGSGKSTLIQVFFRLVEPSGGKIIIDGTDISVLGLHDLRSCFGIIPQEPVLFEGTVRSNIDLTGQYTNEDIWKSLERCQLKEAVSAKPEKLDSLVVDNGENWSVGQRQLLCSGRVMLKQSRILFMDEESGCPVGFMFQFHGQVTCLTIHKLVWRGPYKGLKCCSVSPQSIIQAPCPILST
ncbi:hypothetical protein S245_044412, partial [Arachis hypogaea]